MPHRQHGARRRARRGHDSGGGSCHRCGAWAGSSRRQDRCRWNSRGYLREPRQYLPRITAAGSIFIGPWSPEPMGDYCSGTNHVLPTYGFARAYSGLSVADFQRRITVQELSPQGLADLGPTASTLAGLEGLDAHALAVDVRLQALSSKESASSEYFEGDGAAELVRRLARPEILAMRAYEHAHWDPRFERLHANESPWSPTFD
ncbi:MAG: hypothetical protein EBR10_06510, partial [Planctomycetes bacterium]|nr:hypothetical protein [Planctomycetota bacterium]